MFKTLATVLDRDIVINVHPSQLIRRIPSAALRDLSVFLKDMQNVDASYTAT
jgi:hypothetical protein